VVAGDRVRLDGEAQQPQALVEVVLRVVRPVT
jgi:hypothetical protein